MSRVLAGRAVIVTGASRNIGRAIAVALAEEGASLLVHAHEDQAGLDATLALIADAGGRGVAMCGDLAEAATAEALAKRAQDAFGRLDGLVNNASIRPEAPFSDITPEAWRRVMAVGLDGPFFLSQAVLPALRQSDQAAIVHIGGMTGHCGARNRAHVVTVKAALAGLAKAMAHDLADDGITVNCVVPGLIATERQATSSVPSPHHHAARRALIGQKGRVEDVAFMVRFLMGPTARYVTGQTLHVNGGAFIA